MDDFKLKNKKFFSSITDSGIQIKLKSWIFFLREYLYLYYYNENIVIDKKEIIDIIFYLSKKYNKTFDELNELFSEPYYEFFDKNIEIISDSITYNASHFEKILKMKSRSYFLNLIKKSYSDKITRLNSKNISDMDKFYFYLYEQKCYILFLSKFDSMFDYIKSDPNDYYINIDYYNSFFNDMFRSLTICIETIFKNIYKINSFSEIYNKKETGFVHFNEITSHASLTAATDIDMLNGNLVKLYGLNLTKKIDVDIYIINLFRNYMAHYNTEFFLEKEHYLILKNSIENIFIDLYLFEKHKRFSCID
jgi:hypothetical protein